MTSIFSFGISFIAIVGMIAIKNWEIKRGVTLLRDARFKADKAVASWSTFVKSHIPTKGKHLSKEITHHTAYHVSHAALGVVKFAEGKLVRIINFIKGKGVVRKDRNTSHYMKNVSEYERHPDRK
ncbi:hypothetical protein HON59_00695 [bacterium]|jgi:hypothetical protein|nr:hypothetical protein [bacterium]MBT3730293.1 hypothetical protein [bacterium]MBT4894571.1 hypothetical protein [bacterium]